MDKLLYITNDGWWDTDINVLPELGKTFDLKVICFSPAKNGGKYPDKKLPDYIKFENYKLGLSKKNPLSIVYALYYFIRVLLSMPQRRVFWLVDSHAYFTLLMIYLTLPRDTIVSFHDYIDHVDTQKWLSSMKRKIVKKYKYFHFQSPLQEQYFKNEHHNLKSFSTAMAPKGFGPAVVNQKYFDNDLKTFLFFGYIRDYKHPEMFLEAAHAFDGKANFIITGNCREWNKYEYLCKDTKSLYCNIKFIENSEIPNYYCQSDFLVLPYEDSTQSGPLMTAFYYGIPSIASGLPYFKEMISDNIDGFVFDDLSQEGLNNSIAKAISLNQEQYIRMKESLKRRVEEMNNKSDFSRSLQLFLKNK